MKTLNLTDQEVTDLLVLLSKSDNTCYKGIVSQLTSQDFVNILVNGDEYFIGTTIKRSDVDADQFEYFIKSKTPESLHSVTKEYGSMKIFDFDAQQESLEGFISITRQDHVCLLKLPATELPEFLSTWVPKLGDMEVQRGWHLAWDEYDYSVDYPELEGLVYERI